MILLGFDMLYSLSEIVYSTSGWIRKTNIVSASSLIIQDETEFRPIISCQNVWGVARLGKGILWGPRTKSLITTVIEDTEQQHSLKSISNSEWYHWLAKHNVTFIVSKALS